jgi:2-polyprenyl-6-methoxyphenol hydroxylase-like FAD-dependent oxidoreductase
VVIVGGGPTGLMLAGELALARVDVAIVERRASQELAGSRAGGLHSRTIEVLDQRGIADRFLPHGQVAQVGFLRDDPSRHQRLSDSPQLRARAVAGPHRAHTRRLGRRAGGTESERPVNPPHLWAARAAAAHGTCAGDGLNPTSVSL